MASVTGPRPRASASASTRRTRSASSTRRSRSLLEDQPALFYPLGADAHWDARAMNWLNSVRARARAGVAAPDRVHDVRALIDDMRLVKDAHELSVMRRAARIAAGAHRAAMQATRPGRNEYEIEAELAL